MSIDSMSLEAKGNGASADGGRQIIGTHRAVYARRCEKRSVMPKVSVKGVAHAKAVPLPPDLRGDGQARAYFCGAGQPLHLHAIDLPTGGFLHIEGGAIDKVIYVWRGQVAADDQPLGPGSSIIFERGGKGQITTIEPATLLAFSAGQAAASSHAGGHVHLLPAERAPRSENLGGSVGLGGVMHADADCPTCSVWLHENRFPGGNATRLDAEAGIHSHSEDEIIFVLDGEIRLGARLYGPGTALAIAADTLYSFTAGPTGLHFANFRASKPGDIQFANGASISETAYWRDRLPRPDYLTLSN